MRPDANGAPARGPRLYIETRRDGGCEIALHERVTIAGHEHTVTLCAIGATPEQALEAWAQLVAIRTPAMIAYREAREGVRVGSDHDAERVREKIAQHLELMATTCIDPGAAAQWRGAAGFVRTVGL